MNRTKTQPDTLSRPSIFKRLDLHRRGLRRQADKLACDLRDAFGPTRKPGVVR